MLDGHIPAQYSQIPHCPRQTRPPLATKMNHLGQQSPTQKTRSLVGQALRQVKPRPQRQAAHQVVHPMGHHLLLRTLSPALHPVWQAHMRRAMRQAMRRLVRRAMRQAMPRLAHQAMRVHLRGLS